MTASPALTVLSARAPAARMTRVALALTVALVLASQVGCGGGFEVVEERPLPEEGPEVRGFIVFPVADMTPGARTIDVAVRTSDVAAWLLDRTDLPVVGPLDYKIFKEPDEMRIASVDTNLVTGTKGKRRDLRGWVAVWVQITENRATNVRDIVDARKKGKKNQKVYRMHGVEATVRVEVQLLDAMRGKRMALVVVKDKDNPTRMKLKGDPRPPVTTLVHKALRRVFADAEARVAPEQPTRIVRRAGTLPSGAGLASFRTPDKPSMAEVYAKKDEIERKTAMFTLWSRLAPELGVREVYFPMKFPGLLLTADRPPLKKGDVILEVEGRKMADRYQLDQALRACKGRACKVKVQRGFKSLTADVVWLPVPRPEAKDD